MHFFLIVERWTKLFVPMTSAEVWVDLSSAVESMASRELWVELSSDVESMVWNPWRQEDFV